MKQNVMLIFIVIITTLHLVASLYYSSSKVPDTTKKWEDFNTESTVSEYQFEEICWQVALLMKQDTATMFLCSGLILHQRFVVTAAECVGRLRPQDLRVVTGPRLQVYSSRLVGNYTDIYNVSEVFSPSPPTRSRKGRDDDLVVLKLETEIRFDLPQLPAVTPSLHLSENCFTLGWGILSYNEAKWRYKCPRHPSTETFLRRRKTFTINRLFDIRNTFSLSTMLIIRVGQMFNMLPLFRPKWLNSDILLEDSCSEVGGTREALPSMVKLSSKSHHKCPCSDGPHLCLHSWNIQHSLNKVDIGSPVFCEIKKQSSESSASNVHGNTEYGLAGIVTQRSKDGLGVGACNWFIHVIKASNIAKYSRFLSAVLHYES